MNTFLNLFLGCFEILKYTYVNYMMLILKYLVFPSYSDSHNYNYAEIGVMISPRWLPNLYMQYISSYIVHNM